jgi:hypothetical protein
MILRSEVPQGTNLNRYFEIMNTRGEQLEKHEILKSNCLDLIKDEHKPRYLFNLIWEACSNMDRYIQMSFTNLVERRIIFDRNYDTLQYKSFNHLLRNMPSHSARKDKTFSTIDIIKKPPENYKGNENENIESQRFHSPIDFPNFLIQVLRIQEKNEEIKLDDKHLLEQFKPYIDNKETGKEFVKKFSFNLLKCKYLMDKFIIKREYDNLGNRWCLKKTLYYSRGTKNGINYLYTFGDADYQDDINKELIMLLAMFHVSMPTMNYKHWFSAVLNFLSKNADDNMNIDPWQYKEYLESLAKSFLFDNYLATEPTKKDYYEIILMNLI